MKRLPDLNPFTHLFVTRIGTSHPIILHSTGHLVCFQPGVDRKLSVESIAVFLSLALLNAVSIETSTIICISDIINLLKAKRRLLYLTLRRVMSYIYGASILDVSRSHTTTQHSR